MAFVKVETRDGIATVVLSRGKVNALNGIVIDELRACFNALEADPDTTAIVFTGSGKFFSFGFDIPEFLSFAKDDFRDYLINFTDFYTYLFLFPKPVVAALNGHTIAGGCMLALACDYRAMAANKGKISLNEIAFGSAIFAGSTEMLRFLVGSANAAKVLYSGAMYSAEEALGLGLVQEATSDTDLMDKAKAIAADLASKHAPAFAGIKALLRKPVADGWTQREKASISDFLEIWYAEPTWTNLRNIKIY